MTLRRDRDRDGRPPLGPRQRGALIAVAVAVIVAVIAVTLASGQSFF